jgi:hypothetical protein
MYPIDQAALQTINKVYLLSFLSRAQNLPINTAKCDTSACQQLDEFSQGVTPKAEVQSTMFHTIAQPQAGRSRPLLRKITATQLIQIDVDLAEPYRQIYR